MRSCSRTIPNGRSANIWQPAAFRLKSRRNSNSEPRRTPGTPRWFTGKNGGFADDELLESGITLKNENNDSTYDRFRNRLIFPIWNEQGRVVGFSARTIEKEAPGAKYVNSPETPVFKKSNILYALPLARKAIQERNMVILCEGQLDTIAMHRAGLECTVAPQGTAFTDEQARILKRYTDRVYLAFDSDSAGQKATARALELLLPLDFEIKVMRFPVGSDPDEIFRNSGEAGLNKIVDEAVDMLDFLCEVIFPKHDRNTPFGKSRIIGEMLGYFRKISKPVAREMYIQELSSRLGVKPETVFSEYNKESKTKADTFKFKRRSELEEPPGFNDDNVPPDLMPEANIPAPPALVKHAEKTLLEVAMISEETANQLAHELPAEKLTQTVMGKALNELINCTLNGEWEHITNHLSDFERENPSPELSKIMIRENPYQNRQIAKAVADSLTAINEHYRKIKLADLMQQLRSALPEEKMELLKEFQELSASNASFKGSSKS